MPRQPRRKVVLPEGELRRFRLPEGAADRPPASGGTGDTRWMMVGIWVLFTAFCFWVGQRELGVAGWLTHKLEPGVAHAARQAQNAPRPSSETQHAARAAVTRPDPVEPPAATRARPRATLLPVLRRASSLPVHAGGVLAGAAPEPAAESADAFDADLPAEPFVRGADFGRKTTRPIPPSSAPEQSPAQEFEEDLPLPGRSAPVKMQPIEFPQEWESPNRGSLRVSTRQAQRPASPGNSGGSAHTGGGCERAYQSAERRLDIGAKHSAKDVSRERYARTLEDFSKFAHCQVPEEVALSLCVAVQLGRVLGVTVTTRPASAPAARCVARTVRQFSFPSSPEPDLVRTEFTSQ